LIGRETDSRNYAIPGIRIEETTSGLENEQKEAI
jgi:hypothetical protein